MTEEERLQLLLQDGWGIYTLTQNLVRARQNASGNYDVCLPNNSIIEVQQPEFQLEYTLVAKRGGKNRNE